MQRMGLDSGIGLLLAASELSLVRLIRGAIAENAGGAAGPLGTIRPGADSFETRARIDPEPEIEPRRTIEPEPRVEPRTVYYTLQFQPVPPPVDPVPRADLPPEVEASPSPIRPPWEVPIWEQPVVIEKPIIKKIVVRPDVIHKGALLDFFM